ncbi:hypothetical protein F53441_5024 [Fusarium austroafricanum]|uniref:SnoaL-like domain-containing protein n=1 Tax=Fusarium austroafricanum TaxID=2364996 RepID=A0A8H4KJ17_9HYPO|nr:hypothetical protein F53441_5024 [Fusarium austroafricanum]
MTSQQELRKAIEHTISQYFSSYKEGGEQNDPSLVNRDVTDACERYFKPLGVHTLFGSPPDQAVNNTVYEAAFAADLKTYTVQDTRFEDLTIDTEARKAAAMTVVDMLYRDGQKDTMEHSWIFDFNEDGSKITRIMEFCDMDGLRKMFARIYPDSKGENVLIQE